MSLQDDIDLLLTCAPAISCPREEACFRVAKHLRDRLHSESPAPHAADHPAADDLVADYAPDWERRNGFIPCRED